MALYFDSAQPSASSPPLPLKPRSFEVATIGAAFSETLMRTSTTAPAYPRRVLAL